MALAANVNSTIVPTLTAIMNAEASSSTFVALTVKPLGESKPESVSCPGTGYRVSEGRRQEINAIRDVLDRHELELLSHLLGDVGQIAFVVLGHHDDATAGAVRA